MNVERRPLGAGAPDPALVGLAAEILAAGGVLVIPTESSYGLAVDPRDARGADLVYEMKGREGDKALPVVAADADQLTRLGIDAAHPLVQLGGRLWPAALSVVVPVPGGLPASAGTGTLAVRVPAHGGLVALLAALGRPLTATSANTSGTPPLCDPGAVASWLATLPLPGTALLVDGGSLPGGPPSTLVAIDHGAVRHATDTTAAIGSAPAAIGSQAGANDGGPDGDRRLEGDGWRVRVLRPGRVALEVIATAATAVGAGSGRGAEVSSQVRRTTVAPGVQEAMQDSRLDPARSVTVREPS